MNPLKNFIHSLRRYKAATLLNLFGLTVAFASFILIMTQVKYDLTFDHHYTQKDRIYRLESKMMTDNGNYCVSMSRPAANEIFGKQSDIEKTGLIIGGYSYPIYDRDKGEAASQGPFLEYLVEPGVLEVLEFQYLYGSPDRIAEPNTVILSQEVATALYGNRSPIGRSIVYGKDAGNPKEIIAVYKNFPENSSVKNNAFIRFVGDQDIDQPGNWGYTYFVRLKPGSDPAKCERSMVETFKNYGHLDKVDSGFFRLDPITELHFAQNVRFDQTPKGNRTTVYSLITVALLIVVIAMINFVNFSTSLVPLRIRSFNTQKVFGETNGSIRRNLIGESTGIAIISFGLSLVVVNLLSGTGLMSLIGTGTGIGSDMQIVLYTGFVAVAAGVLAGIYPAFYSTSFQPALVLKGAFGLTPKGRSLRAVLVSFQYVVSIVLIVVALSVYLQNRYLQKFDMGFQRENILTAVISERASAQWNTLGDRLKSNPAIVDVAFADGPFVGDTHRRRGRSYKGKDISFDWYPVTWNFLSFMGLKVTGGCNFAESDEQKETPSYIFNQVAQREDSILAGDKLSDADIVGIVQNFNFKPLQFGVDPFAFYLPGKNGWEYRNMFVKIRTSDVPSVIDFIHTTIRDFDPGDKPDVTFLDESIGQLYQKEQNLSKLISLFGLLSVLISIVGVFGLILFETQYRRKEVGVRKAFGSSVGEILRMFNKGFVRIVLVCFVVASPIAYYIVKKWLENFAYQMPVAIWVFVAALLAVLLITIITITVQSYRTATENPVDTLKSE